MKFNNLVHRPPVERGSLELLPKKDRAFAYSFVDFCASLNRHANVQSQSLQAYLMDDETHNASYAPINKAIINFIHGGTLRVPCHVKLPNSDDRTKVLSRLGITCHKEGYIHFNGFGYLLVNLSSLPELVNIAYSGINNEATITSRQTMLEMLVLSILSAGGYYMIFEEYQSRSTYFDVFYGAQITGFAFESDTHPLPILLSRYGNLADEKATTESKFQTLSIMQLASWRGSCTTMSVNDHLVLVNKPTTKNEESQELPDEVTFATRVISTLSVSLYVGASHTAPIPLPLEGFTRLIIPLAEAIRDHDYLSLMKTEPVRGASPFLTVKARIPHVDIIAPANMLLYDNPDFGSMSVRYLLYILCNTTVYVIRSFTDNARLTAQRSKKTKDRFITIVKYPNNKAAIVGIDQQNLSSDILSAAGDIADGVWIQGADSQEKLPDTFQGIIFSSLTDKYTFGSQEESDSDQDK